MDCTQVLDDINFGDATHYKEGEKKQVIVVTYSIFILLMNSSAMKVNIGQILANPFLTCFGRSFLQTHLNATCLAEWKF